MVMQLILETVHRSRDPSFPIYKFIAAVGVDRHDRRVSQKSSEFDSVPDSLSDHGDQTDRRRLLVDHTDGHLIGYYAGYRRILSVARNGDHVKTDRTHAGHSLEFLKRQASGVDGVYHSLILAHRDESSAQAAHIRGRHNPALFDLIVQKSKGPDL